MDTMSLTRVASRQRSTGRAGRAGASGSAACDEGISLGDLRMPAFGQAVGDADTVTTVGRGDGARIGASLPWGGRAGSSSAPDSSESLKFALQMLSAWAPRRICAKIPSAGHSNREPQKPDRLDLSRRGARCLITAKAAVVLRKPTRFTPG